MTHALWDRNGKSWCSGQVLRFPDVAQSGAAVLKATNMVNQIPGDRRQSPQCVMPAEYGVLYLLTCNNSLDNTQSRHMETKALLSVVHSFITQLLISCCRQTSDIYGSLSVGSVLPRATADEDAQREVQVRANLFACPSISSFLIRIVQKSTAGGRLYGHQHPTFPYSLALPSLAT